MKLLVGGILFALVALGNCAGSIKFAPYYDTFLKGRTNLLEIALATNQVNFHLAFALGGSQGCVPTWGAEYAIDDPEILGPIKAVQQLGGEMIVATGGALGPYLEHSCTTVESLVNAYKIVLDTVGTTHLDVDVETTINFEIMNKALAQLQKDRPEVTLTFTLMVQGEDYGITPALGVDLLLNAKANGARVDIVNLMTMEYPKISEDFGDSCINAAISTMGQLKEIYPEKSSEQLKAMIGITPMIGRNFNGQTFELSHARKVTDWAQLNNIGLLAFWSIERDNSGCSGTVSPFCSGVAQNRYDFTKVFQNFN